MRTIEHTGQFKRDVKRELKGRHRATLSGDLAAVLERLACDLPLEVRHRDHALIGDWHDHRDCHIRPDLVLIYRLADTATIQLVRLGSHAELGLICVVGASTPTTGPIATPIATRASFRMQQPERGRCRLPARQRQNASASNAMVLSAPALIRVSRRLVSGSIRSMKNRPPVSFDSQRGEGASSCLMRAALAIRPHM